MCEFRDGRRLGWYRGLRRLARTSAQAWLWLLTVSLAGAEDARTYPGHYRNAEYGFPIAIPGGRICRGVAAPAPAHGCRVAGGDDRRGGSN